MSKQQVLMFLENVQTHFALQSKLSALAEAPDAIVLLAKEAEFSFSRLDLADGSLLDYPNQFTEKQLKDVFASGR